MTVWAIKTQSGWYRGTKGGKPGKLVGRLAAKRFDTRDAALLECQEGDQPVEIEPRKA